MTRVLTTGDGFRRREARRGKASRRKGLLALAGVGSGFELAAISGLPERTCYRWLAGHSVSISTLYALAKALGTTVERTDDARD